MKKVLTKKSKELFSKLAEFSSFYLAGDTGLALQLGHRVSVDFGLFSDEEIPKDFINKVEDVFEGYSVKPLVNTRDELSVLVGGVKITFLYYPFPVLFDLVDFEGLKVLGKKEIGAAKAYSLGRRIAVKDYVDLYFLLRDDHLGLEELIDIANKKFGEEFNSRLFLEQLVTLPDGENLKEVDFLDEKVDKDDLESFLSSLVDDFNI